jgi:hypothetical protein
MAVMAPASGLAQRIEQEKTADRSPGVRPYSGPLDEALPHAARVGRPGELPGPAR